MSTIPENSLSWMTGNKSVRIAVCGGSNCGKTVFLTSLINHLLARDPSFAPDGWRIEEATLMEEATGPFTAFPYHRHRASLVQGGGGWPGKTTSVSKARISVRLKRNVKKWYKHSEYIHDLELLDLPGERIADIPMYGVSFSKWCTRMMHEHSDSKAFAVYYERCRDLLQSFSLNEIDRVESQILASYRDFLFSEITSFSPRISPSVCVLSDLGASVPSKDNLPPEMIREELDQAQLGVDVDSPFAPLPPDLAASGPLAERFKRRFIAYRKSIVDPIVSWLENADKFCYLVDVLGTLRDGPVAYNGTKRAGEAVLDLFPKLSWIERNTFNFSFRLDDLYFIATKADCVLPEKGNLRNNLRKLLREMFETRLKRLDLKESHWHIRACAAVKTTTPSKSAPDNLEGWFRNENGMDPHYGAVLASHVPPVWPPSDQWGKFVDPSNHFVPRFAIREDEAPPQIGLDQLSKRFLD